jgi:hypothetical protein
MALICFTNSNFGRNFLDYTPGGPGPVCSKKFRPKLELKNEIGTIVRVAVVRIQRYHYIPLAPILAGTFSKILPGGKVQKVPAKIGASG